MNSKILKSLIIMIGVIAAITILTTISEAASLSISTSKSSVAPGEVFTVTVTLNGGAGPISASASNGTGSGSQWLENSSLSFSCTAGSSGSVSISASGTVGDFTTELDEYVSDSKSVTIVQPVVIPPVDTGTSNNSGSTTTTTKPSTSTTTPKPSTNTAPVTKSSNSKLESLQIAEGAISPEFSSSVKEYSINVPNETTKLSIAAVADSSKATVKIKGNEELVVGENAIEIIVTAEDGSQTTYTILAKRAEPELCFQTLNVSYINENAEKVDLILNPQFTFNIYEYSIDEIIPHTIKSLEVMGTANRENAVVEVLGNEELKTGKNEIIVKVRVIDEAGLEEQKTYKISLEKQAEPVVVPETTISKISSFFGGIGTGISKWISDNFNRIITGMLLIATAGFAGLTIYFVYDYKNYKKVLAKLAELNKANLMERVNVALDPELANSHESARMEQVQDITQEEISQEKKVKGRRFK